MSDSLSIVSRAEVLKSAYVEVRKLRSRVEELERFRTEPVAIIGIGCRFPGGANNPEKFWELLREGRDAIGEVPRERWDADAYYDSDPERPRKMCTRFGGFLSNVELFDPQFFGITPREAVNMDPQQRLLLEVSWEALEYAGVAPPKLNGSRTGVFIGICSNDYSYLMISREPDFNAYMGSGASHSVGSGRLSYILGLQGPSLSVDTACSSSLVSIHLACQSLRVGECTLALAGGVNLVLIPEPSIMFSKAHMLAPDGRCKTFDASADGYVRSEGCGIVVLKRYSDAVRDGDRIVAVIRGSAVNQDGRSSGLTVPNGPAQEAVVREALSNSGIDPAQVDYVETHGTGTSLGDPIEVQALGRVMCSSRDFDRQLMLGSVKTNLGHTEGAAGVAALIKTILSLEHGEIPPHLHFKNPNPRIPWDQLPISVPVKSVLWPSGNGRRIAGISSFGFSGTNAHVIVEKAPAVTAVQEGLKRPLHLLCISAKTPSALSELTSRYREQFLARPEEPFEDICFTANTGRSHFAHRLTVTAATSHEALSRMIAFEAGRGQTGVVKGNMEEAGSAEVVFLYPGESSHYAGMGRLLYDTQPVFRAALQRCDELLRAHLGQGLLDVLYSDSGDSKLDETAFTQPALFALEFALTELWRSWGIRPDAILGHGVGEYAAACAAGVFSLEDAIKLVAERSQLMQSGGIAETIRYAAPIVRFISTLTGRVATGEEVAHPDYWLQHAREGAQFSAGMQTLRDLGYRLFVEIGPTPILLGLGRRCFSNQPSVWLPSLRKMRNEWEQILESVAALYVRGIAIDWSGFDGNYSRRKTVLPTYPFQRERCWIEDRQLPRWTASTRRAPHPLLGRRLRSPLQETQFESEISSDKPPILQDHRVYGKAVFPAAAYLEAAVAAGSEAFASKSVVLENVAFHQPLVLDDDKVATLQFILKNTSGAFGEFQFASLLQGEEAWTCNASGWCRAVRSSSGQPQPALFEAIRARCPDEIAVEDYYATLQEHGLEYGKTFRWLDHVWRGSGEAVARLRPPLNSNDDAVYRLNPGLLDSCFQLIGALLLSQNRDAKIWLPVGLDHFQFYTSGGDFLWSHVQSSSMGDILTSDVRLYGDKGELVAEARGLHLRRMDQDVFAAGTQKRVDNWLYEVQWRPSERAVPVNKNLQASSKWLILADEGGVGAKLADRLESRGDRCHLVYRAPTDADSVEPFAQMWRSCQEADERLRYGVIHLWSLDTGIKTPSYISLLHLVQAVAKLEKRHPPRLWFISRGTQPVPRAAPDMAITETPAWGLGRVIALEHPELHCIRVDLDPLHHADEVDRLLEEILSPNAEDQIAFRKGTRYVPRLARSDPTDNQPSRLEKCNGVLDGLALRPQTRRPPGAGEIEIRVRAAALNFKDVLNALDIYPGDAGPLGSECVGDIVAIGPGVAGLSRGETVVALAPGSFGTFVTTRAELAAAMPSRLTVEEAATLPIAFLTADYALRHLGHIGTHQRVLIHAAAGGVGLAAVQLAMRAGAEIFATAGSPEKRARLGKLGLSHVMNSRTLDFAAEVMEQTSGEGVDLVLNSLTGESISRSLSILKSGGGFLEIGKTGIWDAARVTAFRSDISYHVIALDSLTHDDPAFVGSILRELMQRAQSGAIEPLPRRVFAIEDAVAAFRHMAQAKHIGKVVIIEPSPTCNTTSQSSIELTPKGTYLITGGVGALGLLVAKWMAQSGARNLMLVSRSSPSVEALEAVENLRQTGVRVLVTLADVSREQELAGVLEQAAAHMPALRGVIHAAGVLDDGVLLQQTSDRFARVMAPKVEGAWNLHKLTQESPLDFFVLFSSAASLLGSPGQGNYAAANAFLDGLAHFRRANGLPGLSINWGPWAEVGAAARRDLNGIMAKRGITAIRPEQGLDLLSSVLRSDRTQVGILSVEWPVFMRQFPAGDEPPFFEFTGQSSRPTDHRQQDRDIVAILQKASLSKRRELLLQHVRELAYQVLGLDSSHLLEDRHKLFEIGMDSLMAVELRNRLQNTLGRPLPSTLVFEYPTVETLSAFIYEHLFTEETARSRRANGTAKHDSSKELDSLSEIGIAVLLDAKLSAIESAELK